ncbi:unnamed protein product [Calypogeia fissa]
MARRSPKSLVLLGVMLVSLSILMFHVDPIVSSRILSSAMAPEEISSTPFPSPPPGPYTSKLGDAEPPPPIGSRASFNEMDASVEGESSAAATTTETNGNVVGNQQADGFQMLPRGRQLEQVKGLTVKIFRSKGCCLIDNQGS